MLLKITTEKTSVYYKAHLLYSYSALCALLFPSFVTSLQLPRSTPKSDLLLVAGLSRRAADLCRAKRCTECGSQHDTLHGSSLSAGRAGKFPDAWQFNALYRSLLLSAKLVQRMNLLLSLRDLVLYYPHVAEEAQDFGQISGITNRGAQLAVCSRVLCEVFFCTSA